jgi:hypothetical protein
VFSQKKELPDLSGLWIGILHNDITNKDLHYEIAISGHNGNYSGYSYTTFVIDTVTVVGVKDVIIVIKEAKIFIVDDHWVVNKSKIEPPKHIKQLSAYSFSQQDTNMTLTGHFSTTRTYQYKKSVTGTIVLHKKGDRKESELMPVLDSLGVSKNLSFLQPKAEPVVLVPKKDTVAVAPPPPPPPPVVEEVKPPVLITGTTPETRKHASLIAASIPKRQPRGMVSIVKQLPPPPPPPVVKKEPVVVVVEKKQPPPPPPPPPVKKDTVVAVVKKPEPPPPPKEEPKKEQIEGLAKRKIETIQTVAITADSIKLELYDNGYVDGDIISVIVNGKVVLEHQMLSLKPITKIIHITPDMGDSIKIIMYAENLGSIPPNTGLLSVYDGDVRYDIRFSGDLTQNAAIILTRKRK